MGQQVVLYSFAGPVVARPELPAEMLRDGTPDIIGYGGKLYKREGVAFAYYEARFVSLKNDPATTGYGQAREQARAQGEAADGGMG